MKRLKSIKYDAVIAKKLINANNGVAKGEGRKPSPPILQTKHKHTYKLHKICQFGQFIFGKIIKIVATRSHL